MPDDPPGPPVVTLPAPVERRMRLGPFPSARDALKFLCYAAVGAFIVSSVDVPVGLGVVGAGLLAALYQPEGRGWDERLLMVLRWKSRANEERGVTGSGPPMPLGRQGFVRLGAGDWVTILRTGGTPLAYLPPAELARRFERYRDLLRGSEGRLLFLATLVAIRAEPFLPSFEGRSAPAIDGARTGYADLVRLLCRRRSGRRVYLAVAGRESGPDAIARLEVQASAVREGLLALGLKPVRLKDRALVEATRRFGWAGLGGDGS